MRKPYLDNLRWAAVLLVTAYHVCFLFNGLGIPGGIPGAANLPALDIPAYVVYPWFMVLLFLIAGMSARWSLARRGGGQFLRERAVRLLVPSTLGLFAFHWITGYLNIRLGGGLEYIPSVLLYPIAAVSGIGPLWFIQLLFLFSCLLVLLRRLDRRDRLWTLGGNAGLPALLLLFFPIWGAAQVGNMPLLTMYRFGIYFAAFLIGYFVFSHDEVQETVAAARIPLLCLSAVGAVLYTVYWYGSDYTSPQCLQHWSTNLYLWLVVLAVLGCGKRYFDRETPVTRYLSRAGFGLYVLHYPVLLYLGWLLNRYARLPAALNYLITLAVGLPLSLLLYEAIRRIPVLRFLVLGLRKKG